MKISYHPSSLAHEKYDAFLCDYIQKNSLKNICEVGGGANPSLSLEFIRENNLRYTLLDISQEELDKAPDEFHKIRADIASDEGIDLPSGFDFIFSKMVAEHIKNENNFHRNIYRLLQEGGHVFHFIPTLWALPYVMNRLMPEKLGERVLLWIDPNRKGSGNFSKFPAYYKACRGPTKRQLAKMKSYGYDLLEYRGFFGHGYYYRKVKPLLWLHEKMSEYLIKNPRSTLTSYAYVLLRKPNNMPSHEQDHP